MTAVCVPLSLPGAASEAWRSSPSNAVSTASAAVLEQWTDASIQFTRPISRLSTREAFAGLAETWREERGFTSSLHELVLSQSYQQVIALGPDVVPYILDELRRRPDHWFWALSVLTGVNPVPDDEAGNVRAMTDAWLQWGEQEGLLP